MATEYCGMCGGSGDAGGEECKGCNGSGRVEVKPEPKSSKKKG